MRPDRIYLDEAFKVFVYERTIKAQLPAQGKEVCLQRSQRCGGLWCGGRLHGSALAAPWNKYVYGGRKEHWEEIKEKCNEADHTKLKGAKQNLSEESGWKEENSTDGNNLQEKMKCE